LLPQSRVDQPHRCLDRADILAPLVDRAIGAHARRHDDVTAVAADVETRADLGIAVADFNPVPEPPIVRTSSRCCASQRVGKRTMVADQFRKRLWTVNTFDGVNIAIKYPYSACRSGGDADHSLWPLPPPSTNLLLINGCIEKAMGY